MIVSQNNTFFCHLTQTWKTLCEILPYYSYMLDFLKFLKITQETVLTQHTTLTPEILAKFDSGKKKASYATEG